jgi:hypothetical protein
MPLEVYRVDMYNINNGQYYYGRQGAAYRGDYVADFEKITIDPLKDSGSSAKGNAYTWVTKTGIGEPTVYVNDTKVEDSFDKDKK